MILAVIPDLIMRSKVDLAARHYGVLIRYASDAEAFSSALAATDADPPRLIFLDLDAPGLDGPALVRAARAALPDARIVGFCSHVMTDLFREARAAGASTVMPNSNFSAAAAGLVSEFAHSAPPAEGRPPQA